MTSHSTKLLPTDHDPSPIPNISSQSSPPPSLIEERESPSATGSSYTGTTCCYNSLKLSPPFDSAMALTVLVLLIALFFMGFFSIYIRRFADESRVDPTRRRGRRRSSHFPERSAKGVDPTTVESLPVYAYDGGGAKQGMECAICLSEFEEREWVKEIPYCGHVFHVECIDTWLLTHVTCPLCRTAKLLPGDGEGEEREEVVVHVAGEDEEERGLGVGEVQESDGAGEAEVRILVVDEGDTWNERGGERVREVGPVRRSSTSSWSSGFGERERLHLHRSLSF